MAFIRNDPLKISAIPFTISNSYLLARVYTTCASTCVYYTCQHMCILHMLARVYTTRASTCVLYTCQHVCLLHVLDYYSKTCPLEAPRLFIGLEIIPKCYQIRYIGQTYPFTHFHNIYGFPFPKFGPKYGPFKQNKVHC